MPRPLMRGISLFHKQRLVGVGAVGTGHQVLRTSRVPDDRTAAQQDILVPALGNLPWDAPPTDRPLPPPPPPKRSPLRLLAEPLLCREWEARDDRGDVPQTIPYGLVRVRPPPPRVEVRSD